MYNNFSFLINLISCNAASSCPLYVYLHPISNATFTSFQSFNTRNPSTILHLFFNTPPTIALLFSFRFNLPFNFANNCFVVNRSPRINATISSSVIRKSSGEGVREGSVVGRDARRSSGGGLGESDFPPDLRLNLIRLTFVCCWDSSSRRRFLPAGEMWKRTINDLAPGPSRPVIAVGVGGRGLTGVAANGEPARDTVVPRGFGEDFRDGGLGLGRRDEGALLGVSVPLLSFLL